MRWHSRRTRPVPTAAVYEQVVIGPSVRATIAAHIQAVAGCETGGILLGYADDPDTLSVSRASPPGPRAVHRRFFFLRDTPFLQRLLDRTYDRSDGREDYVGEWHVHRALDAPPSKTDRRSMWRIARRKNYAPTSPILLIVEEAPEERRFRVYGFEVKPKKLSRELQVLSEPATATEHSC